MNVTDRTDRTDRQTDRQLSDGIGRTVLQTVAQKPRYLGNGIIGRRQIGTMAHFDHIHRIDRYSD